MEGLKKKRHPLVTCAMIFFAVLIFFIAAGLWVVAATGVVYIPAFSRVAYTKPEPLREVTAGVPVETYIQTLVTSELASRLQQGGGQLLDPVISVTLPENAITATVQSFSETYGDILIDIQQAQVAISEEIGIEVFLPIKNSSQETAVNIHLMIEVLDGDISIEVQDVWIGSLHVPDMLVSLAISSLINRNAAELNAQFGQYITLSEIDYQDGSVTLSGDLSVEIISF